MSILKNAVSNLCKSKIKSFSVEICSNKKLNMEMLSTIKPIFYSVTWHFNKIITINDVINSPAMIMATQLSSQGKNVLLHLPCRYMNKQNVFDVLTVAKQRNIVNIFALFGESVEGYQNTNDFKHAIDLVKYIRETFGNDFCVCVAGYPQRNCDLDLKYLQEKVSAGADFIITQVIFDMETFDKFYKNCRRMNISVPIIPGLYLINSYETVLNMAKICHVVIPEKTLNFFESIKDNENKLQKHAEDLIHCLLTNEDCPVPGIHLFCLNDIELVEKITKNIDFGN